MYSRPAHNHNAKPTAKRTVCRWEWLEYESDTTSQGSTAMVPIAHISAASRSRPERRLRSGLIQ